jgi:hypothetical protein
MDGPSVRRLVADHPIAAFLVIGNAVASVASTVTTI